uniref:Fibropellin-1-like n=1 Tax=Branchiostoma floridae TaxID=7739 RepID=C3ZK96_BRAFL|eukprot:XP_002590984.1 hypothetical protein BRAFLDRAFT_69465 [Branchiostoma floridae]
MWTFLLLTVAVVTWPAQSQGQEYLTTLDTWGFFKVQVSGQMTNANVKATCEAAGMRYPCHSSGDGCTDWWTYDCITYDDAGVSCETHRVLSANLCGTTDSRSCQTLDDTFVNIPGWRSDDSAYGVDYETHTWALYGGNYYNKYALCTVFDGCRSSPCRNGATCQDGVNSFTCQCVPGFTGTLCEDMDDCASNPCWFGGTCVDGIRDFICVCPKGFEGEKCEIAAFSGQCYQFSPDALSHPEAQQACSTNSGHLADVKDAHQHIFIMDGMTTTTGASNWLGMKLEPVYTLKYSDGSAAQGPLQMSTAQPPAHCDLCVLLNSSNSFQAEPASCTEQHNYVCLSDIVSCEPNICQNGGNCTSCFGGSSTFCDCPDGFKGKFCEMNINECASNPCQNGGTCHDDVNSYGCSCLPGYTGDSCESDIDLCALVTCPFDWICLDLGTHFTCLA